MHAQIPLYTNNLYLTMKLRIAKRDMTCSIMSFILASIVFNNKN